MEVCAMTDAGTRFVDWLRASSVELHAENPSTMASGTLIPTPNKIDEGDAQLFWDGVDAGIIELRRGGRFNTADRPTTDGRWGALSRSQRGGWFNAEYLPQIAAYVDAVLGLGYPHERVLFELPASAMRLDLAILDDAGRVVVLGEAKRDVGMLATLRDSMIRRFADAAPGEDSKRRGDEARQLAWRIWTVEPDYIWLIAPGRRDAFRCRTAPLHLEPLQGLPPAGHLGLAKAPPTQLPIPRLL
jgi:hypothetical protein